MRCLRGHQRHGAFSCCWLRAAGLLCKSLGVTVSSTEPTQKKRNNAASARMFAAKRLRAAVVACGAVGAGAARGAATKAVKSAPGTIYRRGSCHPEADFFIARGQWLAPRPQPLQRSTAPVKKRERAILSPFRISRKPRLVRLGHPQKGEHHSETKSLNPSAHPAHLQPRLLRSFGQRSGARRREKR